jgi:hypothetical protein
MNGMITRSSISNGTWTTNATWSYATLTGVDGGTILDISVNSVMQCTSVPILSRIIAANEQVIALICTYDLDELDGPVGYVDTIYEDGTRTGPQHAHEDKYRTAGIFHDFNRNVLFWSQQPNRNPSAAKRFPYKVMAFHLGITYKMVNPPISIFESFYESGSGDHGIQILSPQIHPISGDLYFYSNSLISLSIAGTIRQVEGYTLRRYPLHPLNEEDDIPRIIDLNSGGLRAMGFKPSLHISSTGEFRVFNEDANVWMSYVHCVRCGDGKESPIGAQSIFECECRHSTYLDSATDTCFQKTTECAVGSFIYDTGSTTEDATCAPCSSCSPGYYWPGISTKHGCYGEVDTGTCEKCQQCERGYYIANHTHCSPDNQDHCAACTTCVDLEYIAGRCTGYTLTDVQTCVPCETLCDPGKFIPPLAGCDGLHYSPILIKTCQDCNECEIGETVTTDYCNGTTRSAVQGCSECDFACNEGEFIDKGCEADEPRCATCPSCPTGTYQNSTCTGKSRSADHSCIPCKKCGIDYIYTGCAQGSLEDDSDCIACADCSTGRYMSHRCPGTKQMETYNCTDCAICDPGTCCIPNP